MQVIALEHCKKLAGEKSYIIKLLQDGWKPSVKEERNVNIEHVLVDPLLKQTISLLRLYGFHWNKTDAGHVWRFPGNLQLGMHMKRLCSYLLNIFLGRYYLSY